MRRDANRLYWFARGAVRVFARLYFRMEIHGSENVPMTGPLIIAPNHSSFIDPPLVGCACPRALRFMAKAELFRNPLIGSFLRKLQAFPVHRGTADIAAVRISLERLKEGDAMILFIEGTRNPGDYLLPPTPGVALLARQSGAPVVPVGITNTHRAMSKKAWFPKPVKVKVAFGKPFTFQEVCPDVNDRHARDAFSHYVMQQIQSLLKEHGMEVEMKEEAALER
jgi:1-acyl-sn-glycerol-3-phosphate acyltransferase